MSRRRLLVWALEVVGLAAVVAGVWQVYAPAAVVLAGVALVFLAQGVGE